MPLEADDINVPRDRMGLKHELRTGIAHVVGYAGLLLDRDDLDPSHIDDLSKIKQSAVKLQAMLEDFFVELPHRGANDVYPLLHDLRTPVNHIIGYAEIILEDLLEDLEDAAPNSPLVPDLEKIRANVKRWLVLIERYVAAPELPGTSDPNDLPDAAPTYDPESLARNFPGLGKFGSKGAETGHILIVDDDPQNREILERRLSQQGHLVDCLDSGEKAIDWLASFTPDLVLLDMLMPGLTGREVLASMKQMSHLANIPVVVISALDDQAEIARCIELGAEDYLSTPFNPAVLRARVTTCLERRRLRKAEMESLARLEEAKQKSDSLLLNILPGPVAERLKAGETNIADYFEEATVVFVDLVGFTAMASERDPKSVVGMLNDIFSRLDLIAQKHGLEKIKTIGDAYMAVAGLPIPRKDHAEAIARFSLDLKIEVNKLEQSFGYPVNVRIGMDSGPVIAGIIGRNKFIYDLWGDTVNMASRMESTGITSEIQCSERSWLRLKDNFVLHERGEIEVKGKGRMKAWILDS